ncbi:hypothetical protein MKW92_040296 [Papaver armeniacum]|nr:hypothetical protein MKW92_040296 [Papaver armeniacum]
MSWTNYSLTEKKIEDLADRTNRNINPNDTSCNDKKLEAPKNFWRIFQRRSIYMDTLLYLINIPRINAQFSLDLKKGEIDKKNDNDEIKKEEVEERKKKRIHVRRAFCRFLIVLSNDPRGCVC